MTAHDWTVWLVGLCRPPCGRLNDADPPPGAALVPASVWHWHLSRGGATVEHVPTSVPWIDDLWVPSMHPAPTDWCRGHDGMCTGACAALESHA